MIGYKKVGGLHFVRVGRFGASFFASKREQAQAAKLGALHIVAGAVALFLAFLPAEARTDGDAFAACIEELAKGNPAIVGCRG